MAAPTKPEQTPDWASAQTLEPQGTAPVGANDCIVPPASMQDSGWPQGQVPVRQYENGILRIHADWLTYLSQNAVPRFDTLRDALLYYAGINGDAYEAQAGQVFRLDTYDSRDWLGRVVDSSNLSPAIASAAVACVTDGYNVYVAAGSKVVALQTDDLTEVWRTTMSGTVYSLAFCNGRVLVGLASGVVRQLDPADGTDTAYVTVASGGNVTSMSSDGRYTAVLAGTKVALYNTTSLQSGFPITLAGAVGVAITKNRVWVAFESGGVYQVNVYTWGASLDASLTIPSSTSTPTPYSIFSDGQFVAFTNEVDDDFATISVYTGGSGKDTVIEKAWSAAMQQNQRCCIDDSYVFAAMDGTLIAYDRSTGKIAFSTGDLTSSSSMAIINGICSTCDAVYIAGDDGSGNAMCLKINLGHTARTYQVVYAYGQYVIPQGLHAVPVR